MCAVTTWQPPSSALGAGNLVHGPAATSRAVVDLGAVAHNAAVLARAAGTPWMAVVKADAYGHGLGPVATTCLDAGATWLGVAQLAEALHLRRLLDEAGVARPQPGPDAVPTSRAPRLLTWILPVVTAQEAARPGSSVRAALDADLDLSVATVDQARAVAVGARAQGVRARVHLKIDTGMSRGGAVAEDLAEVARVLREEEQASGLVVVGLWSHLSRADEPASGSTQEHLARFRAGEEVVRQAGLRPRLRHLAATGGLLWHPQARLDLVRAGIGLYGLSPDPSLVSGQELGLRPAMRLEAPLTLVKRIAAGQAVSYGGTWTAPTDRWVGVVPLGYSDGVPRAASSCGPVSVGRYRTTVVGRVCMDQVVVDLGPAAGPDGVAVPAPAAAGDVAVLWGAPSPGPDGPPVPTADEWARACDTINYEIVTRLGPRVPRYYLPAGGATGYAQPTGSEE
ncbi:alanine racemase [Actinomyces lilanjuaniae]|uniref:Alanine racemase n=1 Tax=Actinomyces lilanjuaniae TaxID=2321394 RepID=A0ABN5PNT4_9ACTO|nr:alanine racemase [Actinomyces lilanjuaniae]